MNLFANTRLIWGIVIGYSFILALVPFFYGGTPYSIIPYLSASVFGASLICLLTFVFRARRMRLPLLPTCLIISLLAYGWFMVFNAKGVFDSGFWEILPLMPTFPSLPGSIDKSLSREIMFRLSAMTLVMLTVIQLGRKPAYLIWVMKTIAISAALICCLGLVQRAAGATDIYWGDRWIGPFFYSTFRYHGNAGAFINITWPLIAVFFLHSLQNNQKELKQKLSLQLWGLALLVSTLSLFIHGSRAATGIILLILPIWCWLNRSRLRFIKYLPIKVWVTILSGFLCVIITLSIAILGQTSDRLWDITQNTQSIEMRFNAYAASLKMIPDAGLSGFGPGTFKWMFPFYGGGSAPELPGFWRFLHQDYLQTLIEWGYLGTLLWIGFCFINLIQLVRLLRLPRARLPSESRLLIRAIFIGLLSVVIHALIDFPMQIFSIQLIVFIYLGYLWSIRVK